MKRSKISWQGPIIVPPNYSLESCRQKIEWLEGVNLELVEACKACISSAGEGSISLTTARKMCREAIIKAENG